MKKIAIYGKGGIGKSTTVSNMAAALAMSGKKVMQIGCDPKADSTSLLRGGIPQGTILDLAREKGDAVTLEEMVTEGFAGVLCVEAGGPKPGTGCAGRGIIIAFDKLAEKGAYDVFKPDVVFYDVLGDVVCGGFTMPMRGGYADSVYVITSGENMAIHAAANIAMAVESFHGRGYAELGGIILNKRNVERENEKVAELADDFKTTVIGEIENSALIAKASEQGKTVVEAFPDSAEAEAYKKLAMKILES
ncbi:MAG: AAA family ATPase [Lachnospiraceae bacterium]|nr:AAA family ATPase [Lachnospiraceae bacterium]MBQ6091737.1 AAA family ATPase [Lachnospiraceae bacterium]MBR5368535.1 AAA family ATPase [Lachnospiraceae bacterium]